MKKMWKIINIFYTRFSLKDFTPPDPRFYSDWPDDVFMTMNFVLCFPCDVQKLRENLWFPPKAQEYLNWWKSCINSEILKFMVVKTIAAVVIVFLYNCKIYKKWKMTFTMVSNEKL